MPTYVKPRAIRISRTKQSEALYQYEARLHDLAKAIIREWMNLFDLPEAEFWTRGLPQHLFDYLDSWDRRAAKLAAEAYLELHATKDPQ